MLFGCRKDNTNQNQENSQPISFSILEQVGDTALSTDTGYTNSNILFKTNQNYDSVTWTIGNNIQTFQTQNVNLVFNDPETINVQLHAKLQSGFQSSQKQFVVVENDGSKISPIVGSFKGCNSDNLTDSFVVIISFWFGNRYPWWNNGAYSIQNLPEGFKDTTQNFNGYLRPEITGIVCANGYKNLALDKSGYLPAEGIKGYCSLKQAPVDTLFVNYKVIDTAKLNQTGKLEFLTQKYTGLRIQ